MNVKTVVNVTKNEFTVQYVNSNMQCQGITKKGEQCKRNGKYIDEKDHIYCKIHSTVHTQTQTQQNKCQGKTKTGNCCSFKAQINQDYCKRHAIQSTTQVPLEEEECCVCTDTMKRKDYKQCTTCKIPLHISCTKRIIKITDQYDSCPQCRAQLPDYFIKWIVKREDTDLINFIRKCRRKDFYCIDNTIYFYYKRNSDIFHIIPLNQYKRIFKIENPIFQTFVV
jgi:hypothetical protein